MGCDTLRSRYTLIIDHTGFCSDGFEEEILKDGLDIARQLSRNQGMKQYVEDDTERTAFKWEMYEAERIKCGDDTKAVAAYVRKMAKEDSVVGQVFNNKDSIRFMRALAQWGAYFKFSDIFTIRWIRENVHTTGGGVSKFAINWSASLICYILATSGGDMPRFRHSARSCQQSRHIPDGRHQENEEVCDRSARI